MRWRATPEGVLAFDRGPGFACVVNFSTEPFDLTGQGRVLVASLPCDDGLPRDAAVWLEVGGPGGA
jgi:alpha-glucosidase